MAVIDWHESNEFEPESGSIAEFCRQHEISFNTVKNDDQLLIFIQQNALESLHDFLAHDLQREHGGVLIGKPYYDEDAGKTFLVVHYAIPALESDGSSVHLQFQPETWDYISGIIEENYSDQIVVGWYHSHPGLGVFMSGTDQATQRAFYNHPWNVAIVADPIARQTGWFAGPESTQLSNQQVFSYQPVQPGKPALEGRAQGTSLLEEEYLKKHALSLWRWLLPFGILLLAFLGLTWYLIQWRKFLRKGKIE